MRVNLVKMQERIAFIWGECSNVPDGHVRIRNYVDSREIDVEIFTIPHARKMWNRLVGIGFTIQTPTAEYIARYGRMPSK